MLKGFPTRIRLEQWRTEHSSNRVFEAQGSGCNATVLRKSLLIALVMVLSCFTGLRLRADSILREVFSGIPGVLVSDLTNNPAYPLKPSLVQVLTNGFEAPTDVEENYGQRLRGYIIPPQTGNYTFWIASDDQGALFLSDDDTPARVRRIAAVNSWTSSRVWSEPRDNNAAVQKSAAIPLQAGRAYYIEALMKEGGGGDNLAVRWQLPDGVIEEPIPAIRLFADIKPPVVAQSPQSQSVEEGKSVLFSVTAGNIAPVLYQWRRNGIVIPGATFSGLTLSNLVAADNGSRFSCMLSNAFGVATSAEAVLTVLADRTPPGIDSVVSPGSSTLVRVTFSEQVDPVTAGVAANYRIDQGIVVNSVVVDPEGRAVSLQVSPLTFGRSYTLSVSNVRDRAAAPNTIASNTTRSFAYSFVPLDVSMIRGNAESPAASSRKTGLTFSEIHYHPAERSDGRNLEFIEIYNGQGHLEELGGFKIKGAVNYTFPPGTTIAASSYLVVAAVPGDLQAVHGLSGVLGPFAGALGNGGEGIRLENNLGAVLLETRFDNQAPWPVAADGSGHSLVLARPSYGEGDPRAWSASSLAGGSPGRQDPSVVDPYRTIFINEFLAHTDDPVLDFVELFNYGSQAVDLSGCILTDDPGTARFVIPQGTRIPPLGFLTFDQNQLGFSLSSAGELLVLFNPDRSRVVDAVRFGGQENGVSTGRFPDGAARFSRLANPTPGAANSGLKPSELLISEIHYNPVSRNDADEFVEIFNRTTQAVSLENWRLGGGIEFKFPAGARIPASGFVVVGKDPARLMSSFSHLRSTNTFGGYKGTLSNQGELLQLLRPDTVVSTNSAGILVTNNIEIVVDDVTYNSGGRWPKWADGGGSSLELIDPATDHREASSWRDSDESGKPTPWTLVEARGTIDNSNGPANALHLILLGEGECLVDNVEVLNANGVNVLANGAFEGGTSGWVFQGNHSRSSLESTGGFNSANSLHVRADGRGDTAANRIRVPLTTTLANGSVATIRARVKWLKGWPEVLLRFYGNGLEATGQLTLPPGIGSPGLPNGSAVVNAAPSISNVRHSPVLPAAGQAVTVSASVGDPSGLSSVLLHFRVDPSATFVALPMAYNGAGLFSAVIPGQASGTVVAFHVSVQDAQGASARFPSDAPAREALIRFGETQPTGTFSTYRIWLSRRTIDEWTTRERLNNGALDATFVLNNSRVIYNAGALYSGSPFHAPGWSGPVSALCDYVLNLPQDDALLGSTDFVLASVGNLDNDSSALREQIAFWMLYKLGTPYNHRRYINMFVNGLQRGRVFEDAQQPNSDMIDQWFPGDTDGNLHKIEDWFEFNDAATQFSSTDATLQNFTTTSGAKKMARYRWNWRQRAVRDSANDYADLFALVDAVNSTATGDAYTSRVEALVDVEEWMRVFAVEHIVGNWDSYGYNRGKNMYAYKPRNGKWRMMAWDIDFVLGSGSDPATGNLFSFIGGDTGLSKIYNHPPFRRAYWRALKDATDGPLDPARSSAAIDARYAALTANRIPVSNPADVKTFIAARRSYILQQLASVAAPFAITSNGGNGFSSDSGTVTLTGTAPVEVKTILFNGVAYPLSFTSVNAWRATIPLVSGLNNIRLQGLDSSGGLIASAVSSIAVQFTGAAEPPERHLVINEILYRPAITNAGFVEIFNRATNTAYDLTGVRLEGADFAFPQGFVLQPQAFTLVVAGSNVFRSTFGNAAPVAGEFRGKLDRGGETLRLLKRSGVPEVEVEYDRVRYDDDTPWPAAAATNGHSLQRIDAELPGNRLANWGVASAGGVVTVSVTNVTTTTLVDYTSAWRFEQSGAEPGTAWRATGFNDASWPTGTGLHYVESAALPATKGTALTIGRVSYYFRTRFNLNGTPSRTTLKLSAILDDGAVVYLNGTEIWRIGMPAGAVDSTTVASRTVGDAVVEGPFDVPSEALRSGENVLAIEVHQSGAASTDVVMGLQLVGLVETVTTTTGPGQGGAPYTPGAPNNIRSRLQPFPTVWINEVQPLNLAGIKDASSTREPWIELHNSSSSTVPVDGLYLSDSPTNLTRWALPSGASLTAGQFRIVFADQQPEQGTALEWHAAFRPPPTNGMILLSRMQNGTPAVLDYVEYRSLAADRSLGSYPDGQDADRQQFHTPTPGAPNNPASFIPPVFINEWMAANGGSLADPVDGDFEDWFEMYNSGSVPVDLSGYYLTDSPTNTSRFMLPQGTVIPPLGFLLCWADEETGQNSNAGDLHANFKLAAEGEFLGLYAPDGRAVNTVLFARQTNDVSQGRVQDGGNALGFFARPTPRSSNSPGSQPVNRPPIIAPVSAQTILAGSSLSLVVSASDPDLPSQTLTFSLDPGAPPGASIETSTGRFSWTPAQSQSGLVFPVAVRVSDGGVPSQSSVITFTIAVVSGNRPPLIQAMPDVSATAGVPLVLTVSASDPDVPSQPLVFSLTGIPPAGLTIDPQTGVIRWTPALLQAGTTATVQIRVTDAGSPALAAETGFNINVVAPGDGLRIQSISVAPNGAVFLRWNGEVGVSHRVEIKFSLDDPEWFGLQSVDGVAGTVEYRDNPAPGSRQRYYRLRKLP